MLKTLFTTSLAMVAFAANSVLCRLALGGQLIDAAAFTGIRLVSGVVVLSLILVVQSRKPMKKSRGNWLGGCMLFLYAVTFSYAYLSLNTGTGALILFGAVQITMIVLSMVMGHRLNPLEWTGVVLAFGGFVYLVLPGVSAPSPLGFGLMAVAGIAWGIYSMNGRQSINPLMDTGYNFLRTLPFVVVLVVFTYRLVSLSGEGIVLAVMSGGLTSGIGYAIWYTALRGLTSTQAAVVQLTVPVIAAAGGVLFVGETLSWRLVIAAALVLCGILLVIYGRTRVRESV